LSPKDSQIEIIPGVLFSLGKIKEIRPAAKLIMCYFSLSIPPYYKLLLLNPGRWNARREKKSFARLSPAGGTGIWDYLLHMG
jgi:hypothetical protein